MLSSAPVHLLRSELAASGVVSKTHTFKDVRQAGGVPINLGALYHLLRNRLNVGRLG